MIHYSCLCLYSVFAELIETFLHMGLVWKGGGKKRERETNTFKKVRVKEGAKEQEGKKRVEKKG